MGDMVDHLFPLLKHVKHFLLRNKWPSKERIANISTPILFLMSEKDELVPYAHMDELYIQASKAKIKHKVNPP
jgi:predicted alpha/beta hydrolase